jgi:hypothetical protein
LDAEPDRSKRRGASPSLEAAAGDASARDLFAPLDAPCSAVSLSDRPKGDLASFDAEITSRRSGGGA